jgi:hypothetical protein
MAVARGMKRSCGMSTIASRRFLKLSARAMRILGRPRPSSSASAETLSAENRCLCQSGSTRASAATGPYSLFFPSTKTKALTRSLLASSATSSSASTRASGRLGADPSAQVVSRTSAQALPARPPGASAAHVRPTLAQVSVPHASASDRLRRRRARDRCSQEQ